MTSNQRIAVNFLATYGRSLFALACGLFSGRWLLMTLGEVDYGLYGVVGGLTGFVSFLNNLMGGAVSRYYAYHVGAASGRGDAGLEDCRKWFTTALLVHTAVPCALVLVGYPLGIWAVEHFLTIPPERISACVWVWRFVCMSCFVGMVNVPFVAMYTAKQEIAEMTVYSFVQTTLNVCVLYYMVSHPGDWLVSYAVWACALSVVPQIVMCIRAALVFSECRIRLSYLRGWSRIRDLTAFAACRFAGACTIMLQGQGMSLLTNKFLGPARNAAMAVGGSLSSHSETLAGALDTALGPAITNACGAGDFARMRSLCLCACKFETVLMLVFALPLSLEVNEVMRLWLKTPPALAASLCVCLLVCIVLEKLCTGHWMAIFALGRIGWYQLAMGACGVVVFFLAWWLIARGCDLLGVGYALIVGKLLACIIRLLFGRKIGGLSVRQWVKDIFIPIALVAFASLMVGGLAVASMKPSFLRIVLTTCAVESAFLPLCALFVLTRRERDALIVRVRSRFRI